LVFTLLTDLVKNGFNINKIFNKKAKIEIDSSVLDHISSQFEKGKINADSYVEAMNSYEQKTKKVANGMQSVGVKSTIASVGTKTLNVALNALTGVVIGLIASALIGWIDDLVHANEKAIETTNKLNEEFNNLKNTNQSNINSLKELKSEYKTLSKGVNDYGDNLTLTNEQYERYKQIVEDVVNMSPKVAEGYSVENGYIVNKNGLIERTIELQEQEYRNELRKLLTMDKLTTAMSGYVAEYKKALGSYGTFSEDGSFTSDNETDISNSIYKLFNTNNRKDYSTEDMDRQILSIIGKENDDIDKIIQERYNKYGYYQSGIIEDYLEEITLNAPKFEVALNAKDVGLDDDTFKLNMENLKTNIDNYKTVRDGMNLATESMQSHLKYIAEYTEGFANLSTSQNMFVEDYLKGFSMNDIASVNVFGSYQVDENKLANVKVEIQDFINELANDETIKGVLDKLYTLPTNTQSATAFYDMFINAFNLIQSYCEEHGIQIPVQLVEMKQEYLQTIDNYIAVNRSAAQEFSGERNGKEYLSTYKELDTFASEQGIDSQDEISTWNDILQSVAKLSDEYDKVAEAKRRYLAISMSDTTIFRGFSEENSQAIDDFQSKLQSLNGVLNTLNEKGSLSDNEFMDLIQEFPTLTSHASNLGTAIEDLANTLLEEMITKLGSEATPEVVSMLILLTNNFMQNAEQADSLNSSYNRLIENAQLVAGAEKELNENGKIYNSTLMSLIAAYPQLDESLAEYHAGLIDQKELFNRIKEAYNEDEETYRQSVVDKLEISEEFYDDFVTKIPSWLIDLASSYQIDFNNYKSLCDAKLQLESELAIKRKSLYDAITNEYNFMRDNANLPDNSKDNSQEGKELHDEYQSLQKEYDDYYAIIQGLDDTFKTVLDLDVTTDYKSLSKDEEKKEGDEEKKEKTKIDWVDQSLKVLQEKVDDAQTALENTNGLDAQLEAITKLNEALGTLQGGYKKAYKEYETRYTNGLKKLSNPDEIQRKIESGKSFKLKEYSSEDAEVIQELIDLYSKMTETEDKISELGIQIGDNENIEKSKIRQAEQETILESIQTKLEDQTLTTEERNILLEEQLDAQKAINEELAKQAEYNGDEEGAAILRKKNQNLGQQTEGETLKNDIAINDTYIEANKERLNNPNLTKEELDFINARDKVLQEQAFDYKFQEIRNTIDDDVWNLYIEGLRKEYNELTLSEEELIDKYFYDIAQYFNYTGMEKLYYEKLNYGRDAARTDYDTNKDISSYYINDNNNQISDIQHDIDYAGGRGTEEQYESMKSLHKENLALLKNQRQEAEVMIKNCTEGTKAWDDWNKEVQECDDKIASIERSIKDCEIAILKLPLNDIQDRLMEIENQLDDINKMIDYNNQYISAANFILDKEIRQHNKAKELIQDQLDALQKVNDARQNSLALQKAEYNLRRAEEQRSSKVFVEGKGWEYQSDSDELMNARENYQQAIYDNKVFQLNEEIRLHDEEIEQLNRIKEEWSWITTEAQGLVDLNQALLYDLQFEEKVLSGNATLVRSIADNMKVYYQEKKTFEEEQKRYEKLQDEINDTATAYDLEAIDYVEARNRISNAIKQYYPEIFEKYGEESQKIQEIIDKKMEEAGIVEESSEKINEEVDESNKKLVESYTKLVEDLDDVFKDLNTMLSTYASNAQSMVNSVAASIAAIKKSMNGLNGIDLNLNSVSAKKYKAEKPVVKSLLNNTKTAGKSHSGMELGYIGDGNVSRDKKAFKYIALNELKDDEIVRVLQKNEAVLTESQVFRTMDNFRKLAEFKVPTLALNNSQPNKSVSFNGNIIVQGAQNVDGLAKAIRYQLPSAMLQELYK